LEGLVLEMTSQLVPVLMKFLTSPLPAEPFQPPEDYSEANANAPKASPYLESLPESRKSWWSRFWNYI
jgi:hypothetical protein